MQGNGDDEEGGADGNASDWEGEPGEAACAKKRAQRSSCGRRRISVLRWRKGKASAGAAEDTINVRAVPSACICWLIA